MTKTSEALSYAPLTVEADASVQQAAERMRVHDVGALPVLDGGRLVGIVTDRDIAIRAAARGVDVRRTNVREIMTPKVVTCSKDDDVADAVQLMVEASVRRLVVVDPEMRVIGILSIDDLAAEGEVPQSVGRVLSRTLALRGFETDGLPSETL